jgi:hypothetical protein
MVKHGDRLKTTVDILSYKVLCFYSVKTYHQGREG